MLMPSDIQMATISASNFFTYTGVKVKLTKAFFFGNQWNELPKIATGLKYCT